MCSSIASWSEDVPADSEQTLTLTVTRQSVSTTVEMDRSLFKSCLSGHEVFNCEERRT